jgi:hypothetical protein
MYKRVMPRDGFNEAKYIKSLSRLVMLIEDELCTLTYVFDQIHATYIDLPFGERQGPAGFILDQRNSDGGLECKNLKFYKNAVLHAGHEVEMHSVPNGRSPFNLLAATDDGGEVQVFADDGELTDEFKASIGM